MSDGKGPIATRRAVVATVGAAMVATVAACSADGSGKPVWHRVGDDGTGGGNTPEPVLPLELSIKPDTNSTNVQPGLPVVVTATNGTVEQVTVTYSTSKTLAGALSPDKTTWTSTGQIAYGTTYNVKASAINTSGEKVDKSSTFKTATWKNRTLPYLQANSYTSLKSGGTYGVGQPIIVMWDEPIPDKKAAEAAFEVITEPPVEGDWRWLDKSFYTPKDRAMHWRPREYWAPGTKVTVKGNVYGMHFGSGLYGQKNVSVSFTIGKKQVAIADMNTKHMLCYIDDKLVRDIPVSMGKGGYAHDASGQRLIGPDGLPIDFWTHKGTYVVMEHNPEVRMWSGSYGVTDPTNPNYYDEKLKLAVKISYGGIYVHLSDRPASAYGNSNLSHGCVNVGPAHAKWFYDTFQLGDVVEVKNSPVALAIDDGVGDWTMSWDQWTAEQ